MVIPPGVEGEAVVPFELDGGAEVLERPVHPAHVAVCHAPVVVGVGEVGVQIYGPAQVLHRPVAFAHRHVGQSPVVVSVGVAGDQGDGHVEVAHRPRKVAQLRLARPPAVVRHGIAGGQADAYVVVRHRQAVLLHRGVGAGSVEVGPGVVGLQGDDSAVVLRRAAVVPQLGVRQPPAAQGFGVARVRLDPLRQMLDHPLKALATHAVYHLAEPLVLFLRWLPLVRSVMLLVHDAPPACPGVLLPGGSPVAGTVAWDGADSEGRPEPEFVSPPAPSQPFPRGVGSARSRCGTGARDVSMMVERLPECNASLTVSTPCMTASWRSSPCGPRPRRARRPPQSLNRWPRPSESAICRSAA